MTNIRINLLDILTFPIFLVNVERKKNRFYAAVSTSPTRREFLKPNLTSI